MASKPRALVLTGYGLNCEAESAHAWQCAGAEPTCLHLAELLERPGRLHEFDLLMFIGGFSFGDHMGSGHVLAARVRHHLEEDLQRFIHDGKLVLGICNGFQIMTRLGLLPALDGAFFTPTVALIQNDCAAFQDRWVRLRFEPGSASVFTRGLEYLDMPIRHGEGKLHCGSQAVLARLESEGCVAARYADPETGEPTMVFPHNPNGSVHAIAALSDPAGRILGMMPHPEAFLFPENHPHWDRPDARPHPARQLFKNAVAYLR